MNSVIEAITNFLSYLMGLGNVLMMPLVLTLISLVLV